MVHLSHETLRQFMKDCFVAVGVPQDDAHTCADVLITADLLGIDSHGVGRLKPIYIDRILAGQISPRTEIEIVRETPTTAVIDGHNGMGQVIGKRSMEIAIEKAKTYGMGMVAVRNSNHYGIAGYYVRMAASAGMIGITGTNARPSIAPTFGVENMLGTNPLTFGIPTDEEFPFMLDCATSITQRGKIEVYARLNKTMPKGWVIDENGNSKTDPHEVLDDLVKGKAALLPLGGMGEEMGGYKGYGYATVVEILSAALQQGAFLKALTGIENGKKVPYRLGHFFIAINVEAFTDLASFTKTTGEILRSLRNSKKAPGYNRIYTAGEKEYEIMKKRLVEGIPLDEEEQKDMITLRDQFHLPYTFSFEKK